MATNQGVGSSNLSGRANLRMKKILTIIVLLCCINISFSQEDIIGLGLTKCITFYNATVEDKIIYMSWVAGFLSSQNIIDKKIHARGISYDRSIIWLEYFCYKNPESLFKEAVISYIKEF